MPPPKKYHNPIHRFTVTTEWDVWHGVELLKSHHHIDHSHVYKLGYETLIHQIAKNGETLPLEIISELERRDREEIERLESHLGELAAIRRGQSKPTETISTQHLKRQVTVRDSETGQEYVATEAIEEST